MRSALVVGTGLVGTSAALALSAQGVRVHLRDADASAARTAASLGAGVLDEPPPGERVDLAIVAVPPARVGAVLVELQAAEVARGYTDLASVKAEPRRAVTELGGDAATYVGGHPMAGSERSGPLAARAELFEGRPWVLTPTPETTTGTLNLALELATLCRAVPVVMDAEAHDRAVALVSHTPQLVSSLMAARLEHAEEDAVRLTGQGLRDVTRIAASEPGMWADILTANAGVVAGVLEDLDKDLRALVGALRALDARGGDGAGAGRPHGLDGVLDVLGRGRSGQARIPGKHGAAPASYTAVPVLIGDQPGELARLFADAGAAGVNIEDVAIEHVPDRPAGLVRLLVTPPAAAPLERALAEQGWELRK